MPDIDTLMAKLADDTAKLADADPSNPYLASVRRALLAETPEAKRDHRFTPDDNITSRCTVCGLRPNAQVHRAHALPHKEALRRRAAVDRWLLAKYRADDEALYQARKREGYAELDAKEGRA